MYLWECKPRCLDTWIVILKMIGRRGSLLQKANIQVFSSRLFFWCGGGGSKARRHGVRTQVGQKMLAPGRARGPAQEPLLTQHWILTYSACSFSLRCPSTSATSCGSCRGLRKPGRGGCAGMRLLGTSLGLGLSRGKAPWVSITPHLLCPNTQGSHGNSLAGR